MAISAFPIATRRPRASRVACSFVAIVAIVTITSPGAAASNADAPTSAASPVPVPASTGEFPSVPEATPPAVVNSSPVSTSAPVPTPSTAPTPSPAPRADGAAVADVSRNETKRVAGLDVVSKRVPVRTNRDGSRIRPFVEIRGTFLRPGWALKFGDTLLIGAQRKTKQSFVIGVYLTSKITEVPLTAVNSEGTAESETIVVTAPEARELETPSRPSNWSLLFGASRFSYFQTNPGDLQSVPVFIGVRARTNWRDTRFGVFGEARGNPFTISSRPDRQNPQYFESKLLATIELRQERFWMEGLSVTAGGRYSTFLTNGGLYGYRDLIVPSAGVLWAFGPAAHRTLILQFDYFPIGGLFRIREGGLDVRAEIAPGLTPFGWPISLDLRYMRLGYEPVAGSVIVMDSYSAAVVYTIGESFGPR